MKTLLALISILSQFVIGATSFAQTQPVSDYEICSTQGTLQQYTCPYVMKRPKKPNKNFYFTCRADSIQQRPPTRAVCEFLCVHNPQEDGNQNIKDDDAIAICGGSCYYHEQGSSGADYWVPAVCPAGK